MAEELFYGQQSHNKQERSEKRSYLKQRLLNFIYENNLIAKNEMDKVLFNLSTKNKLRIGRIKYNRCG